MNPESKPAAEASLGELMTQLSSQTSRLVRDEMRLARRKNSSNPQSMPGSAPDYSVPPVWWRCSGWAA
jgi:hypothetical protein